MGVKISVFGLGYVGAVSAACLADEGHEVLGVDPNPTKVDLINSGSSPVIEARLDSIISEGVAAGRLRATQDAEEAIRGSELSLICVGTPSQLNGSLDLRFVRRVCEEIGDALSRHTDYHVVVLRSTMLPGSVREVAIPTLERCSGRRAGADFGVCINPEFLREGSAVSDFRNPPKTVIGEIDSRSGDVLAGIYEGIDAPLVRIAIESAEMVKYADNVWHALKVSFANEIGNICKALEIDSHAVMDVFCKDEKLNLSPYYLKPGFAFGGSCLPKDVRALTYKGRSLDLELPVLNAILPSNSKQIDRATDLVTRDGRKKIGILGMSFKAGTDDLRESPMVELIERLLGKGYDIRIYDRNVSLARLVGANRDYILNIIPHIADLMVDDLGEVLEHADVVVVGTKEREFEPSLAQLAAGKRMVDLVRLLDRRSDPEQYQGICW